MKTEHEFAIEDVCIHSVLTYEQAIQLWRILGDEDKIKKAAKDANFRGFQTVYDFAVVGGYNSQELIFHNLSKLFGRGVIEGECPYCHKTFSYPDNSIITKQHEIIEQAMRILQGGA